MASKEINEAVKALLVNKNVTVTTNQRYWDDTYSGFCEDVVEIDGGSVDLIFKNGARRIGIDIEKITPQGCVGKAAGKVRTVTITR